MNQLITRVRKKVSLKVRTKFNSIDGLLLIFAVVMSALMFFGAGVETQSRNAWGATIGVINGIFFLALTALVVYERIKNLKNEVEALRRDATPRNGVAVPEHPFPSELKKVLADLGPVLKETLDEAKELQQDQDTLVAILKDMGLKKYDTPTREQLDEATKRFNSETDRYVQFTGPEADGRYAVEFSAEPFPSDSLTAAQTASSGDTDAQPKKPLTKSQQRRINAQKGHGPITDDELRAKRNEARRAKRAAKKAAESTTSTTTQPGQLPLPGVDDTDKKSK